MGKEATPIELITVDRDNYRRREKIYIRKAALAAGGLAVDAAFTADHSINTVVANIGQQYNSLPFEITLDASLGVLFAAGVYYSFRFLSSSWRASSLDTAIAQHKLQPTTLSSSEEIQSSES